jgi:hypothetical protein
MNEVNRSLGSEWKYLQLRFASDKRWRLALGESGLPCALNLDQKTILVS